MLDKELEPQLIVTAKCPLYDVPNTCGEICYYKTEVSKYHNQEISRAYYQQLLDIFEKSSISLSKLVFIGGEPTIHPHLEELLRLSPVPIRLFTNGLFSNQNEKVLEKYAEKLQPIFFHYPENISSILRERIEDNIIKLATANVDIALRVNYSTPNFDYGNVKNICKQVYDLGKKVSLIGFSFSCPENSGVYKGVSIEDLPNYAQQYLQFVQEIGEQMEIPIALGRPIQPCFLDKVVQNDYERIEKINYLKKYSSWTGKCRAINDFTINVDGTPQLCSVLHGTKIFKRIASVDDLMRVLKILESKEHFIRQTYPYPSKKCENCQFKDKPYEDQMHCQGGCLTYRMFNTKN